MAGKPPATPQSKDQTSSTPLEVWDDAFVFQQTNARVRNFSAASDASPRREKVQLRLEHIDKAEAGYPRTPQRDAVEGLRAWSESPTSPRHRGAFGPDRIGRQEERENWDDDFLDSTGSPAKPCASPAAEPQSPSVQRARMYKDLEEENWDEDFELGIGTSSPGAGPSTRSKRSRRERGRDTMWDSSDDEADDFDREMGYDRNDEEDKTVTSRSRRKPLGSLSDDVPPLPSLPPLPPLSTFLPTIPSEDVSGPYTSSASPFPRSSPSHSVFSIPGTTTSGGHRERDSTYGSTAHLALSLRRTHSAESSPSSPMHQKVINPNRFPQSPETPRERRRLRKKSRPPHLDSSILELDDRAGTESTLLRPSTPDSRPCTPPPSSVGVLPSVMSLSSTHASSVPPVPMSPTSASKSPLLARIGSMRRWGRKRTGVGVSAEAGSPEISSQNTANSPTSRGPPTAFVMGAAEAEADRFDNNKTPRPHSHTALHTYQPTSHPPPPPPPPDARIGAIGPPQTPSRSRFFRGSSSRLDTGSSASARSSLAVETQDVSRAKSKERERDQLRVAIPAAVPMTAQSSQSGESEVGTSASPRRARIRAFGQKLLISKRSASASSQELGKDSSDGEPSRMSLHGYGHRQVSTPLSGETPTRLRPRIPSSHQVPSSLGKARMVFPRHVSGSALDENRSHFSPGPSMGVSGRSVSATGSSGTAASSEDIVNSDRGSDEKGDHRGFMGSMRRISLAGAHAQKHQHQSADKPWAHSPPRNSVPAVPPLPPIPVDSDPLSSQLVPSSPKESKAPSAVPTSISGAIHVDLASPTSSPPRDWLSSGPPRRSDDLPVLTHSKSSSFATSSSPGQNASISRLSSSSQAASLGRASPLPIGTGSSGNDSVNGSISVHRRNSLGDLKIPSRISRAQDGLKRDLSRVREFAGHVEQMQELRAGYLKIATQIHSILDAPPPSRAASPTMSLFRLSRSNSRARSNTNPPPPPAIDCRSLALAFQAIDAKYSIAWECADLLIELGTGNVAEQAASATVGVEAEHSGVYVASRSKNRERAVTLAGDEGKPDLSLADVASPTSPSKGSPPTVVSWRASTGRHDLGHRQLYLLKEMLNNAESAKEGVQLDIPNLLSASQWGAVDEAMDSSLTLPTDESVITNPTPSSLTKKKKRGSRLGMVGIRDMLRSLKRSTARAMQNQSEGTVAHSSTTLSTDSSFDSHPRQFDNHPYNFTTVSGIPLQHSNARRKSETSAALIESMRTPVPDYSPFVGGPPLPHKSSPRRPSLSSLFRIGQKHKATIVTTSVNTMAQGSERSETALDISCQAGVDGGNRHTDASREDVYDDMEDSDWDRMDSTSDVDVQNAAITNVCPGRGNTMKLRKKKQKNQLSIPPSSQPVAPKHHNHTFSSSQGSFAAPDQSSSNVRSPRLSNVDENNISAGSGAASERRATAVPESVLRSHSRASKDRNRERQFASVRTVPTKPSKGIPSFDAPLAPLQPVSDLKLAMTPENIKPLLENARVVTARLHDCLAEVKGLLIRTEGSAFTLYVAASSSNVALGSGSRPSNISSP